MPLPNWPPEFKPQAHAVASSRRAGLWQQPLVAPVTPAIPCIWTRVVEERVLVLDPRDASDL